MYKLGMISQERLKLEAELLPSANTKSYKPCRLAQQRMTLSDPEWPHRALCLRDILFMLLLDQSGVPMSQPAVTVSIENSLWIIACNRPK